MNETFVFGDKVKIKESTERFSYGYRGVVVAVLKERSQYNIGVVLEGDQFSPSPYYFCADELEKVSA